MHKRWMPAASALALMLTVTIAPSVRADWLKGPDNGDDPFKGKRHSAMAIELPGFALTFTCSNPDDLELAFVAPEKVTHEQMQTMSGAPIKLLVIIDDQPKIEFEAELGATMNMHVRIATSGDELVPVFKAAAAAKRRVAIGTEFNGKMLWTRSFSSAGSRRVLGPLLSACKLDANPS